MVTTRSLLEISMVRKDTVQYRQTGEREAQRPGCTREMKAVTHGEQEDERLVVVPHTEQWHGQQGCWNKYTRGIAQPKKSTISDTQQDTSATSQNTYHDLPLYEGPVKEVHEVTAKVKKNFKKK